MLKIHQKAFGRHPDLLGELKCSPDPLAAMGGPTSKAVSYTHLKLPTNREV